MRLILALSFVVVCAGLSLGQNEQAPIVERKITYKDWSYKSIRTNEDVRLRDLLNGKKLTMVVYFAPWCENWRHDAPILQRLYDKYKAQGLEIVAVGLYDPLSSMKANLRDLKVTFPAVYESQDRNARQSSAHYAYRMEAGDARKWGSPWYIFLLPAVVEKEGEILTRRTHVINGEIVEAEGEAFIRKALGLASTDTKAIAAGKNGQIEICEPEKKIDLKKP
jgi:thiol-disulfide isomerase/thioredoxin